MRILSFLAFLLFSNSAFAQDYFENRLFIKIKDEQRSVYSLENDVRFDKILPRELVKSLLPVSKHPLLSSTYELILNESYALDSLVAKIQQLEQIEYAEKVPLYKLFFTPNDPLYSTQWNLSKIQADLAWNLGQGCTQVKIAVTDDGFLMNHEDLVNQWHINTGEINGNGIDDDGNGYIDDWRGWDAANNDNDPSATAPTNSFFTHGTHVAGIVAAQTHNSKGVAAIGYNCKMIPVKIGLSPSSSLTGAFQGLDYAINASGCDVINMSWGGGAWSATFQALFNIAKSKGIICVAAAGNSNTSTTMYPASYNHVISVAASGSTDARASFSNFGSTIDVTAPGVGIPSCLAGSITSYGNFSGTSMASPLVAGLCGLMKCYNPMPADSIEACLKRTCDNINAQNPSFIGQLGAGRINAFQALQCLTKKPKSDFIALDTFQCPTKVVRYQAKSFGIPTLTYNWSFPGGSPATSTSANPMVTYASAGLKSATLITCNSLGCDTMTKTNYVNIDTPKAWLNNRKYTSYNSNPVIITVNFKGNPPYSVTLTDGTNNFVQTNIRSNPYFFSIVPLKDTCYITISSFSDSSCIGNKYGKDTIHRITFAGGGVSYCESSFKFNGTPTNTVVKIDPQNGAAWKDLYSTNGFTWECWFNLGNRSSSSVTGIESVVTASDAQLCEDIGFIFNMPWSGGTGFGWAISGQTGCGAPKGVVATTMTLNANTWYHAAGVMDYSTNTMRLYVNGTQVNSGTINIPLSQRMKNNVAVTIGNQDVNYYPYHTFTPFSGMVDEVRFWNVVRTPAEILANYKTCLPKTTSNLVAYFKADEGSGTTTNSLINGNFVGTLQNSATWGTQVDSVKNCTLCTNSLCRDSLEVNSAQTGWQALQTNGTWGSLTSCNYVTSLFTANAANFPGMNIGNCLWGPIVANPSRTYYNSSSQTSTSTSTADIAVFRKELSIPAGAVIDSVRLWMLSDDFVDSVFINSKNIYTTPIPITYGQVLFTKKEVGIGTALATNYITIKAGDLGGNYGHYFRMKVYYSKVCSNASCKDSTVYYTDTSNWFYQNTSGAWVKATLGINSCGQASHAWSPINLIGIQNGNQMIWGNTTSTTCNVKRDIVIPDVSKVDSIRVLVQADDNIVAFKVNGTFVTSTPFGWNNTSSVLVSKSLLVNGNNTFNIEGTNANGSCAWVAMKMIIYRDSCKITSPTCDTSGLVLCMSMDGNVNDSTKYNHHAINRGATYTNDRNGTANKAVQFNGVNQYLNLGVKPLLKPNNATISMWVKPNTPSSSGYGYAFNPIMVTGNTNIPGNRCEAYFLGVSSSGNNKFHAASWNPATSTVGGGPSNNSYTIGTWSHLTTIFDNDSVKIYINGVLDKAYFKGFATNYSSIDSIIIAYSGNNTNNQRWFNGAIDDLKMYNRVLTAAEVQNLYSKPFTCSCTSSPPPPSDCDTSQLNTGKVLHLDFNGNTQDKSGNNNHATNYGATPVAGKDGVANTAYKFDGVNDYMKVLNSSTLHLNSAFTVTCKMKIDGWNTAPCHGNMIFFKGHTTPSAGNQHIDWVYAPNAFNGGCIPTLDTLHQNLHPASVTAPSPKPYVPYLNSGKWYCFAVVQKNDTLFNYIDGVIVSKTSNTGTGANMYDILIGKSDYASYPYWLNATIDDIRVYNRSLAPAEVKGYCGLCSTQPPIICDTSRRFTYTQCLNDSLEVNLRAGSQYQWSPKLGLSRDTVRNPKIYVTANQRYLVSYLGAKGCQVIDTIDISVRPSAIYPKMEDQLICIGDSVQMTIPIYATNVQWSPNTNISSITANNPFFYPTVNTTYYLQFRDTFGCLHKDTFVVNTKVCCPARARFSIPKEILCFGEDLTITNRSKGPITGYNWNFGNAIPNSFAGANPPVLKFPVGGTYPLRLVVTNGICFDTMTKIVTVVQVFPNAGKDTTNCLGAFVTDLGESPISDWTYKWTPTKYLDDPNIANPKCSIVNDSVNYVVEVIDRNSGCKAYDTVVVYTNRKIDSAVQNLRICGGDSVLFNGIQRKTTGNYYFTIKKADGFCDSFINILRLNVLQKQVIPLDTLRKCEQYIDAKGKKHTQSFIEYDTIRSKSILNCDSLVYIRHVYIYKKVYRDRSPVSGCAPFRYNGKTYTESKMRVDSLVIRNIYLPGCDTIEYINVIVFPKPKAVITPSIPNPVLYKQTVTLSASGGQRYFWLQTGSTNQDIDYKINNTQPKLFTVRVTDENECWDTVSYLVKGILPDTCYYGFPNVFSPNQDNLNDEYIPNMDECTDVIVFAIYDRWGEKVFETNQLKGWNGYFKGRPAPMGVYLYYAEFNTPWGVRKHKGTFTLMR